ncbi:hypothetical protein RYZ20_07005 [Thioclava sp. A2]|uniref:hypothetical protein n=1 Tax=Thioclava sp. FCG-A2 TaxID=3080562 RepID=UPI0029533997|nr:hypothetical protein [Thioclava sp. A2]MDV7270646.1 hypothetical protein [Thioclava sp. A2]
MARRAGAAFTSVLTTGFVLAASTALADVTAEQVWQNWSGQYETYGYTVSTDSVDKSGDTLVISGLGLKQVLDDSSMTLRLPEMRLREQGDGTVEVSFADVFDGIATSQIPGEPGFSLAMKMRQAGMHVIVSGAPEQMNYDVTMPEFVVEMDQSVADGQAQVPVKLWLSMSGGNGSYQVTEGAVQDTTSQMKLGGLRMTMSGADPETGGVFSLESDFVNLDLASRISLPKGVSMNDLGTALEAGAAMSFDLSYGQSKTKMNVEAEQDSVNLASDAQSGDLHFAMSGAELAYSGKAEGVSVSALSQAFPLPVSASMASAEFALSLPVSPAPEARPFTGKVALRDLAVSEELWGMVDPMAQLPHTPATLVADLGGTARATMNLFSVQAAAQPVPPITVETLNINAIDLSLAGARLSGDGLMDIDNTIGVPMPVGQVNLRLEGANALMNSLVAMGLLPEDQVMFARMMLGLYAVPVGEDALESRIEMKEGGEILANGQRIQ